METKDFMYALALLFSMASAKGRLSGGVAQLASGGGGKSSGEGAGTDGGKGDVPMSEMASMAERIEDALGRAVGALADIASAVNGLAGVVSGTAGAGAISSSSASGIVGVMGGLLSGADGVGGGFVAGGTPGFVPGRTSSVVFPAPAFSSSASANLAALGVRGSNPDTKI
jgi:hypothetical protein